MDCAPPEIQQLQLGPGQDWFFTRSGQVRIFDVSEFQKNLFAFEYDLPVSAFGAGNLNHAHRMYTNSAKEYERNNCISENCELYYVLCGAVRTSEGQYDCIYCLMAGEWFSYELLNFRHIQQVVCEVLPPNEAWFNISDSTMEKWGEKLQELYDDLVASSLNKPAKIR